MESSDPQVIAKFQEAVALHNGGRAHEAMLAYHDIVKMCPGHSEAMHNLGILFVQHKNYIEAAEWMQRAVSANPTQPIFLSNYGNVLQDLQRWAEAVPQYQQAVRIDPRFADAHYNLGNALQKIGQPAAAIESYKSAAALNPQWAEVYLNCGNAFDVLGQYDESLKCYEKVVECNPYFSGGYINRANVLTKLGRKEEALATYNQATNISRDAFQGYIGAAEVLLGQSRFREAIEKCQLAIKIKPFDSFAYYLLGTIYFRIRDLNASVPHFLKAIELKPDSADAYNGVGLAYVKAGRFEDAYQSFNKALAINPALHIARINMADAYFTHGDLESALKHFQLLEPGLQPLGLMQFFKLQMGDWTNYNEDRENFLNRIRDPRLMGLTEDPWHVQRVANSAALAKEVAQNFFRSAAREGAVLPPIEKRAKGKKIKIGYFSPDFRDHAVGHLALELFESHSRDKFEVYAFAFGGAMPTDPIRPKLVKAFDHFIEIGSKNDIDAVLLAREIQLDIAVDLAGITSEARLGIFVNRAAPVQVNFLGFTGTIGTNCHDYIIADPVVIPEGSFEHYTEKVVHLPCMMPYSPKYNPLQKKPTRAEVGLPEKGFIFCSFNQGFKFTPQIFDSWMRILKQVPGSYLWLSRQRPMAVENMRREAVARGVDPDRIIFAGRVGPMQDHLERQQLGDLFLDTFPYNAHTSGIDALWAGMPIITRMGETFASRLAGSLVTSLGMKELIVASIEEYEALAIDLANHPEKLAALRQRLAQNRTTHGLFNTKSYMQRYEDALSQMHERYHAELPPEHLKTS